MFSLTYSQSAFDNGYSEGHKKGYCNASAQNGEMQCNYPLTYLNIPLPKMGEDGSSYRDGYNRGLYDGQLAFANNKSNTLERKPYQYKDPVQPNIGILGSNNNEYNSNYVDVIGLINSNLKKLNDRADSETEYFIQNELSVIQYNDELGQKIRHENSKIPINNLKNYQLKNGLYEVYLIMGMKSIEYQNGNYTYFDILPTVAKFENGELKTLYRSLYRNAKEFPQEFSTYFNKTKNPSFYEGKRTLKNGFNQDMYLIFNKPFMTGDNYKQPNDSNLLEPAKVIVYSKSKKLSGITINLDNLNYSGHIKGDVAKATVIYEKKPNKLKCEQGVTVNSELIGIYKIQQDKNGKNFEVYVPNTKYFLKDYITQVENGKCYSIEIQ